MAKIAPSSRGQMRSSRLGGVPTELPPERGPVRQLALPLGGRESGADRSPAQLLPGVVHVAGWLDLVQQQNIVAQFREWALPPAGLRHPRVPSGNLMTVQSVCLGWHWVPYAYSKTADDTDGAPVKPIPPEIVELGRAAVAEAYGRRSAEAAAYRPDAVIANLYGPGARLGLHHDGEEISDAPVVTISIGDTCVFRFAGVDRRTAPFTDVELRSGDLLVFGGPSRRIYHGVPKIFEETAPETLDLPAGRLSLTLRETGLD
jgi:alkylated DNA repair protein (DNA oxidative demethylase)